MNAVPARQCSGVCLQSVARKGALEVGGYAGNHYGCLVIRSERLSPRKAGQRSQAVADNVHVRQPVFVGKNFPGGVEQRRSGKIEDRRWSR